MEREFLLPKFILSKVKSFNHFLFLSHFLLASSQAKVLLVFTFRQTLCNTSSKSIISIDLMTNDNARKDF